MGSIIRGENLYSGSTNYAQAISYTKSDGSKSTVQNELEEQKAQLDALNNLLGGEGGEEGDMSLNAKVDEIYNVIAAKKDIELSLVGFASTSVNSALAERISTEAQDTGFMIAVAAYDVLQLKKNGSEEDTNIVSNTGDKFVKYVKVSAGDAISVSTTASHGAAHYVFLLFLKTN